MATTLFTTYRAPVNSFPTGQRDLGIHKAGRYSGFDILQSGGGLSIILSHTDKVQKTSMQNTSTPAFGSILFKSGIVAHVEDSINLSIETNSGNAVVRKDLIIAENIYQEVSGGTPITYSVVKGPNNSTALPTLPNPNTQIILGVITIAPNGFQFSDLTYEASYPALTGDMTYEVLATIINQQVQVPQATITVEGKTRYATNPEAKGKVMGNVALTPSNLADYQATTNFAGLVQRATASNVTGTGTGLNNAELYITPELLQLFKGEYTQYIQGLINQNVPPQATTTVPGIMRIATHQEVVARTSNSVAISPANISSITPTHDTPGLFLAPVLNYDSSSGAPTALPIAAALTVQALHHLGLGSLKVVEGTVITTNATQGKGYNDWGFNNFTINPPVGFTMADLVIFAPVLQEVYFNTQAGYGKIFLNWRISGSGSSAFIDGVAGHDSASSSATTRVKYTALFIKN